MERTKNWGRVPHLRDGFIVAKVGHFRGSENPDPLQTLKTDRAPHDGPP